MVDGLKWRTQFWKGTTQGPFQQSLVEIGSVVSEKIFFKLHPPFFLFLAWRPSWLEVGITGHNFGRGPFKDHSTKVWLQLAQQWFLRRRFLCEMLMDGRRTKSDGNSSPGPKPGELKMEHRGQHVILPNICLKLPVYYVIL